MLLISVSPAGHPGQRAFHGKRPLESRAVRPRELNALREEAIKANLIEQVPRAGPRGEDGG